MAYQYPQPPQGGYQPQGYNPYSDPTYGGAPPPNQGPPVYAADVNAEAGVPKHEFGFSDQTVRVRFIRKVFTMVAIMLSVVTVMTAIPFFHSATMQFIQADSGKLLYFASYATFLVVYIVLMCCEGVRRSHPGNLILTGILTLSIGYMTMMIAARHNLDAVLLTLIITTISCTGIIVFSMQTTIDFTKALGFVIVATLVLIVFGFVAIIAHLFFKVTFLMTIYAGLAALLFMFYLAIDIQMLMGGRKYEISPEEHVYAAIQIFIDIVYIFWMLLSLFDHN